MSLKIDRRQLIVGTSALILAGQALAQESHSIEMLNKDPDDKKRRMIFKPLIQVVQPGDTITFVSVDKGHNTASTEGMLPEGAESWKSKLSKDFDLTLQVPGFYGYQCSPHTAMGMVGLIIVEGAGKMDNYDAAKAVTHRGKAQKAWDAIWEQVEADGLAQA